MSNFFKRHTPLFDNPSSFQELNPGECCIDDVFLSDAVIALNGSVWELTLTLNDGTVHVAPLPPAFADVYVVSFARHPDALTDPAFVNTIRITLSDGTVFDLDLSFLVGGGEDLAATLVLGNITGGSNIVTSDGDSINAATGNALLNLRAAPDTWFLGNLTSPTTTTSVITGSSTTIGMGVGDLFGLVIETERAILGEIDPSSPDSYFVMVPGSTTISYESSLTTPQQNIQGAIVSIDALTEIRNSLAEESWALFLNTGGLSGVTTWNAGIFNSVAIGGGGITVNTNNTAYANQISLQQAGNTFNTFITPPSLGATADNVAEFQDKGGTIAYLSDISSGPLVYNIYNVNGVLTSPRSLDGFDGVTNHQLAFANLASFVIGATPTVSIATTSSISLTSSQIGIGGATSVSIATPNTIATLGKVGQVLKLNTTIGGCDWEDKYFAVNLNSTDPSGLVSVVNSGSNWTYTVTHNLDSLDVKPELFRLSDGASVNAGIKRIGVDQITVRIKSTSNPDPLYRVII